MKKLLLCALFLPLFASADLCVQCPTCENVVQIANPIRAWSDNDDSGVTWTCRVCKHSNWSNTPPYKCGHCGTGMGKG